MQGNIAWSVESDIDDALTVVGDFCRAQTAINALCSPAIGAVQAYGSECFNCGVDG